MFVCASHINCQSVCLYTKVTVTDDRKINHKYKVQTEYKITVCADSCVLNLRTLISHQWCSEFAGPTPQTAPPTGR